MSNFFKNAHARTKNSPAIIVIWLVLATAFIIACGVAYEDYSTSLLGYQAIPTQKANPWIVPMVALMPQVIQIVLFFNFLTDTDNKRWSLAAAVIVHLVDVGLDVYYKSNSFDSIGLTLAAIIESEIIYTFGSEVLLTMAFGLMIATFPDFLMQSRKMFHNIVDAISNDHKGNSPFDNGGRNAQNFRPPMEQPHLPRPPASMNNHVATNRPNKNVKVSDLPGGVRIEETKGFLDKILNK